MPDAATQTLDAPFTNTTQLNEGFIIKEKIKNNKWITLIVCDSACNPQEGTQTEDIAKEFEDSYEMIIDVMNFEW